MLLNAPRSLLCVSFLLLASAAMADVLPSYSGYIKTDTFADGAGELDFLNVPGLAVAQSQTMGTLNGALAGASAGFSTSVSNGNLALHGDAKVYAPYNT